MIPGRGAEASRAGTMELSLTNGAAGHLRPTRRPTFCSEHVGINLPKRHIFEAHFHLPERKRGIKRTKSTRRRKSTRTGQQNSARAPKPTHPNTNPQPSTRKGNAAGKRQARKEQRLCHCGQPAIQEQTRCHECAEKHRAWHRQNSGKRRRAKGIKPRPRFDDAELIEQIRKEIAAKDKGASRTPKRVRSKTYNQKAAQYQAQLRAERKSLGLCVQCAKPSLAGQIRCADCVLKHRQYELRSRVKAKLTADQ